MKTHTTLLWGSLLLLAGCGTPSNFYRLHVPTSSHKIKTLPTRVIGIAEVDIADYLDQPQMVTRKDDASIIVHETDRWAGALDKNIQQALQRALSRQMPRYAFISRPYDEPLDERYRVYVRVDRFDADAEATVRLQGRWSLVGTEEQRTLLSQAFDLKAKASSVALADTVRTQSQLIDRLAGRIAEVLRRRL